MAVIVLYKVISTLKIQILNNIININPVLSISLSQTSLCLFLLVSMSTLTLDEVTELIKMLSNTN